VVGVQRRAESERGAPQNSGSLPAVKMNSSEIFSRSPPLGGQRNRRQRERHETPQGAPHRFLRPRMDMDSASKRRDAGKRVNP